MGLWLCLLSSDCEENPCLFGVCSQIGDGGYLCSCKPGKTLPLKLQLRLQQTTNFATSFLIFKTNKVPADDSHEKPYLICYF